MPRLIGAQGAVDMIASGKQISAAQALKLGILDAVIAPGEDLMTAAMAMCKAKMGVPPRRIKDLAVPPSVFDAAASRKKYAKQFPGEPARMYCVDAVEAAVKGPTLADGLKVERKVFGVNIMQRAEKRSKK